MESINILPSLGSSGQGIIRTINKRSKYGLIESSTVGTVYVSFNQFKNCNPYSLQAGQYVEFVLGRNTKGWIAHKCKLLSTDQISVRNTSSSSSSSTSFSSSSSSSSAAASSAAASSLKREQLIEPDNIFSNTIRIKMFDVQINRQYVKATEELVYSQDCSRHRKMFSLSCLSSLFASSSSSSSFSSSSFTIDIDNNMFSKEAMMAYFDHQLNLMRDDTNSHEWKGLKLGTEENSNTNNSSNNNKSSSSSSSSSNDDSSRVTFEEATRNIQLCYSMAFYFVLIPYRKAPPEHPFQSSSSSSSTTSDVSYHIPQPIITSSAFISSHSKTNKFRKLLETNRHVNEMLSIEFIQAIHHELGSNDGMLPNAGHFRTNKNAKCGYESFVPYQQVNKYMKEYVESVNKLILLPYHNNNNNGDDDEPEIEDFQIYSKAALVIYRFLHIHPFSDGNGRVARVLGNWTLMRCGLPFPVLFCPTKESRKEYIAACRFADSRLMCQYVAKCVAKGWNDYEDYFHRNKSSSDNSTSSSGSISSGNNENNSSSNAIISSSGNNNVNSGNTNGSNSNSSSGESPPLNIHHILSTERSRQQKETFCAICLCDSPTVSLLCCGASSHIGCLAKWKKIRSQEGSKKCPSCRTAFSCVELQLTEERGGVEEEEEEEDDTNTSDTEESTTLEETTEDDETNNDDDDDFTTIDDDGDKSAAYASSLFRCSGSRVIELPVYATTNRAAANGSSLGLTTCPNKPAQGCVYSRCRTCCLVFQLSKSDICCPRHARED